MKLFMIREKIENMIRAQSLSVEESSLWNKVLNNSTESSCGDILWFLENEQNGLRILTENIKEKAKVIQSGDIVKWEELLKKDGMILKS